MVAFSAVLLLTGALGSLAIPTSKSRTPAVAGNKFSVPAVQNAGAVKSGSASLLKAYSKFGVTSTKGLSRRQDGSVTAEDESHVEYLCPVTIGGQTLNLDFDTGSADMYGSLNSLLEDMC
jgi:hypothetical protein